MKYAKKNSHRKGEAKSGDTRHHLHGKQRFDVYEAIKKNIQVLPGDSGVCAYVNGASDASIAEQMGCSEHSVSAIRKECFGRLYNINNPTGANGKPRIDDIAKRLEAIEEYLTRKDPIWRD